MADASAGCDLKVLVIPQNKAAAGTLINHCLEHAGKGEAHFLCHRGQI
jgi:hypothetical protein